jgi:hypothetical protein
MEPQKPANLDDPTSLVNPMEHGRKRSFRKKLKRRLKFLASALGGAFSRFTHPGRLHPPRALVKVHPASFDRMGRQFRDYFIEYAIAFEEGYIRGLHAANGLEIRQVLPGGSWSPERTFFTAQDIVIARKAAPGTGEG